MKQTIRFQYSYLFFRYFCKNLINLKLLTRKIVSYFLLILFLQYFCSVTLFMHTHEYRGVQITHSHPFGGSTSKPNQHTDNEFMLIQILSDFLITFSIIFLIVEVQKTFHKVIFTKKIKVSLPKLIIICFNGLRSPPKAIIPIYC
jgi:hypothetical protein